jgi:predicted alpha/beta-fold hydrolase
MGGSLKKIVEKYQESFPDDPLPRAHGVEPTPGLNDARIETSQLLSLPRITLRQFNTFISAPLAGFTSVDEYYTHISSSLRIPHISIPFLALNALDDPIVMQDMVPVLQLRANPWCVLGLTKSGGHLGWFEDGSQIDGGKGNEKGRWFVKPVYEFLKGMVKVWFLLYLYLNFSDEIRL